MVEECSSSATCSDEETIQRIVGSRNIEGEVRAEDFEIFDEVAEAARKEMEDGSEDDDGEEDEEGDDREEEELVSQRARSATGEASVSRRAPSRKDKGKGKKGKVMKATNSTMDGLINSIASEITAAQLEVIRVKYDVGSEVVLRIPEPKEVAYSDVTLRFVYMRLSYIGVSYYLADRSQEASSSWRQFSIIMGSPRARSPQPVLSK